MRNYIGRFLRSAALVSAFCGAVFAPAFAASVTVTNAWIRELPANLPAAGYFTLHNDAKTPIALTGASSPACGSLAMHETRTAGAAGSMGGMGGMSSMREVARVDVPPGGTIRFEPGGFHLMCMEPKPAIKPGNEIAVTLDFSDGTNITAEFAVRTANGAQ